MAKCARVSDKVNQTVRLIFADGSETAVFTSIQKVYRFVNGTQKGVVHYRARRFKARTIPGTLDCWEAVEG